MADARTIAKLEARIRERLAHAIEFELADPRAGFITITKVELNRDLSQGKILYSVLGSPGERTRIRHMLEDAAGFLQRKAGKVLHTRRIPRLVWHYDDSIEKMAEMDRLIKAAMRSDRDINPEAHGELPPEFVSDPVDVELAREVDEFEDEELEDDDDTV